MLLLGSHVGMSGKDMLVNSVKDALSYDANTFMVYTGAPQNTRRKDISELCIPQARKLMDCFCGGKFSAGMHNKHERSGSN